MSRYLRFGLVGGAGFLVDAGVLALLLARSDADHEAGMLDAPWPPVYPKMPHEPPRVAPSRAAGGGDDA